MSNGAEKLMFLGSSLHLPEIAPQPLREDSVLTDRSSDQRAL